MFTSTNARTGVVELKNILPIEWLHIQKTGSAFGNILLRWACDEDEENVVVPGGGFKIPEHCKTYFRYREGTRPAWPIGDHFPLPRNTSMAYIRHVVTLIRSPQKQKISHFYHSRGNGDVCSFLKKRIGFGYQTSFVTGEKKSSTASCAIACFRLSQFAFLGITDFWEASVCLFHKEVGGIDLEIDSQVIRLGKYNHTADMSTQVACDDAIEDCMFQCALDNFLSRITKNACAFLLRPTDLGNDLANWKLKMVLDFIGLSQ